MTTKAIAEALEALEVEYTNASGSWCGVDWSHHFTSTFFAFDDGLEIAVELVVNADDPDVDAWSLDAWVRYFVEERALPGMQYDELALWYPTASALDRSRFQACVCELVEEAKGYRTDARLAAALAEARGADAIKAARLEAYSDAAALAREASGLESDFGDSPTWGPFAQLAEELEELAEELEDGPSDFDDRQAERRAMGIYS